MGRRFGEDVASVRKVNYVRISFAGNPPPGSELTHRRCWSQTISGLFGEWFRPVLG